MKSINQIMTHGFVKYLLFPMLLFLFFFKVAKKPNYNWDVVFYVGTLFNSSDKPIAESRLEMISTFEKTKYIDYEVIYPKTKYGENVFFIDKVYQEQFAFYDIRVLYNLITKTLYKLGFDPVLSVYLNSALFACLCLCISYYYLLFKIKNALFSFLVGLFIITREGFKTWITSSPDTLSSFALLLFIIFFLEKKYTLLIISGLFAVLSRTDNIIFVALVLLLNLLFNYKNNKIIIYNGIGVLVVCVSFFVLNKIYQNAGYRVLFYHTFIDHQLYPLSNGKKISYLELIASFKGNIFYLIHPLIYIGFILLFNHTIDKISKNFESVLIAFVLCVTFSIKFMLFPDTGSRFVFHNLIFSLIIVSYYFRYELRKLINE